MAVSLKEEQSSLAARLERAEAENKNLREKLQTSKEELGCLRKQKQDEYLEHQMERFKLALNVQMAEFRWKTMEYQLKVCRKEIDLLRELYWKEVLDHQKSRQHILVLYVSSRPQKK
jgi:chromosome segregation ATPase